MSETVAKPKMLTELGLLFLKLGTTAFGGPPAHVALMQDEVVVRRKWLSQEEFLDYLSATNFIPGPNSTELAIHIGNKMAGWRGLFVAGIAFIFPAVIIVSLLGWMYVTYGNLPAFQSIMYGIKPVIIPVVAQAIWSLGKTAVKTKYLALLALVALALSFMGVNELVVIFSIGFIGFAIQRIQTKTPLHGFVLTPLSLQSRVLASATATLPLMAETFSNEKLFLFFLKVGSVLFGSGYVLLAFLRGDLVEKWHWLTESQLLDAIAVGQFTPGPVFTTATFIGYILSGPWGAMLATLGIFLPAFVFVAISAPILPKLRESKTAAKTLDAVNVASLAVMTATGFWLAKSALVDFVTAGLAIVAGFLLIRLKINSAYLVIGGGLIGFLLNVAVPLWK